MRRARVEVLGFGALDQALEGVLADRFEHRRSAARPSSSPTLRSEALVDERRERRRARRRRARPCGSQIGLGALERAAADEDRDSRRNRTPLRLRRAGRSSSRSRRAASAGARAGRARRRSAASRRLLEPARGSPRAASSLHARGGQLDRQRQAVEPGADRGDRRRVRVRRPRSPAAPRRRAR